MELRKGTDFFAERVGWQYGRDVGQSLSFT
jgi:hypothetical protein